jgi:hypothetical protein
MSAPAAVGDAADLLHIDMDHVTGMPGDELAWLAVGLPNGVDEASVVQPECREVAGHGALTDPDAAGRELKGDARRRPL